MPPLFPTRSRLWEGAVLVTIAHAIWTCAYPILAYEVSWDGHNYNLNDSQGTRGTVTFADDATIGAFFDSHSHRSPYISKKRTPPDSFFRDAPPYIVSIATRETLRYLLHDFKGEIAPVITTAFWSDGERLTAAESWQSVFTHGAHLIRIELMEEEDALKEIYENYEMPSPQLDLALSLFRRKIASPGTRIVLNNSEQEILLSQGATGINESRELLGKVGIALPE